MSPTAKDHTAKDRSAAHSENKPSIDEAAATGDAEPVKTRKPRRKCNSLDGKRWIQNSISIWSDIQKTLEEKRLKHPAMFPSMLVERLIDCFLDPAGEVVLDPFSGSGSTVAAATQVGKIGIGLEISPEYVAIGRERLAAIDDEDDAPSTAAHSQKSQIHQASIWDLDQLLQPESVDLCITSPPYWDILNQRRTADHKQVRHYGNLEGDLGTIADYEEFLKQLVAAFDKVYQVLKPGAYCCVVVMDIRKKNRFYPFHSDLATRLQEVGFLYDDLIIWNRQAEYNNLRPLGYPSVFRINKVHEYIVLMQKPRK